jgi:hypothetical protein
LSEQIARLVAYTKRLIATYTVTAVAVLVLSSIGVMQLTQPSILIICKRLLWAPTSYVIHVVAKAFSECGWREAARSEIQCHL